MKFALPQELFASRFISEELRLEDSFVWLVNDNQAAIAIVTRRMGKGRLAAFGLLPENWNQGLTKQMLTPLFTSLKEKKLSSVRLKVMRENTRAVAPYHSLGFRFADICANTGEIHSPVWKCLQGIWNPRLLMTSCVPSGLHQMMILWLASPLPLLTAPCDILRDNEHTWRAVVEFMGQPQVRCMFVEPAYRYQGRANTMLNKINARWPCIVTSAAIPETLAPLFTAAGYRVKSLCQFEMELMF